MQDDRAKVDAYIARAQPWARPILERIRRVFHKACPDIEERLKWGCPSFLKHGIVGGMAAFKAHVSFGFWRGTLLDDPNGIFKAKGTASFMAEKLTSVSQLPADALLVDFVKRAVALNARLLTDPKKKGPSKKKRPEARVPPDFAAALKKNAKAVRTFEGFPPSHRREYVEWITEAKRPETRKKRIDTTMDLLTKGLSRNWKYENC